MGGGHVHKGWVKSSHFKYPSLSLLLNLKSEMKFMDTHYVRPCGNHFKSVSKKGEFLNSLDHSFSTWRPLTLGSDSCSGGSANCELMVRIIPGPCLLDAVTSSPPIKTLSRNFQMSLRGKSSSVEKHSSQWLWGTYHNRRFDWTWKLNWNLQQLSLWMEDRAKQWRLNQISSHEASGPSITHNRILKCSLRKLSCFV